MEETNREKTNYIRSLVKDRPFNYEEEKTKIIDYFTRIVNGNAADLLLDDSDPRPYARLASYIYNLPFKPGWKRKHIYLLVNELIAFYENQEVLDVLFDIETGIDGDCLTYNIERYQDEPQDNDEFCKYVRGFSWLHS